jgi:hypothetical protein
MDGIGEGQEVRMLFFKQGGVKKMKKGNVPFFILGCFDWDPNPNNV